MAGSLDGRRFRAASQSSGAEVGAETVFTYHQDGDLIWARYAGGQVRLGHLVGLRRGDELDFRYSQLNTSGRRRPAIVSPRSTSNPTVACNCGRRGPGSRAKAPVRAWSMR